jgi:hypothetical protein
MLTPASAPLNPDRSPTGFALDMRHPFGSFEEITFRLHTRGQAVQARDQTTIPGMWELPVLCRISS